MKLLPLLLLTITCLLTTCQQTTADNQSPTAALTTPNLIIILADDLGYGDLGCYGSPRIRTPHLDRMAAEGLKLTSFYAFPSCSPSRAALLTGCYPPRVGVPDVVGPPGPAWTQQRQYGLNPAETTLAEVLKAKGYATGMVGKWHLGHWPETMPLAQGFDRYYGLPYSNDMLPPEYPDLPLYDDTTVVELNPDQALLTGRYTDQSLQFIREHRDTNFFLYLAHSMPHVPLFVGEAYADGSGQGLYADVVEELDGSVGTILRELETLGIDDNTLVVFTSDNGPWLTYGDHAGSAGPFREGKGTTLEGGMRVPTIVRWPARVPAGRTTHAVMGLQDLLPTIASLTEAELPSLPLDGYDRSEFLFGAAGTDPEVDERPFFFYRSGLVDAVRRGRWKYHLDHQFRTVRQVGNESARGEYDYRELPAALYDVVGDPGERYDRAAEYPELVVELRELAEREQARMDSVRRPPFRPEEINF